MYGDELEERSKTEAWFVQVTKNIWFKTKASVIKVSYLEIGGLYFAMLFAKILIIM